MIPDALTVIGLEARTKTIAATKMFVVGVSLALVVLALDYFVTGFGV